MLTCIRRHLPQPLAAAGQGIAVPADGGGHLGRPMHPLLPAIPGPTAHAGGLLCPLQQRELRTEFFLQRPVRGQLGARSDHAQRLTVRAARDHAALVDHPAPLAVRITQTELAGERRARVMQMRGDGLPDQGAFVRVDVLKQARQRRRLLGRCCADVGHAVGGDIPIPQLMTCRLHRHTAQHVRRRHVAAYRIQIAQRGTRGRLQPAQPALLRRLRARQRAGQRAVGSHLLADTGQLAGVA
ncbi:hypothetical protein D3C71_1169100 [compost metagenome]